MTETVWLFLGLLGVLTVASAVATALSWRSTRKGDALPSTLANLNSRIKAWWIMVAAISIAFLFGKGGVILLFAFVSFAALREYVTLTHTRRGDHWILLGMFLVIIPVQYYLLWIDWYGLFAIFVPVYCFLAMPALTAISGDTARFLERVSEQQWGIMLSVYCISHVPALLTLPVPGFEGKGLLLIAFLIATVQGSDVLQYVFGKLFGRHKVAPKISPSKTWEGLIGGIISASLLGAALSWLTPFTPLQSGLMAGLACIMGFFGGLVASAIKRDRGVKDWGHMIEGHGGMLDRADSLVFAAPVFFHIVRYFWTELEQIRLAEITQQMARAISPWRALGRQPDAVRQCTQRWRRDRNDVVHLVGKALARPIAILDRREHRAEIEHQSVRILVVPPDRRLDQRFRRARDLGHVGMPVEHEPVLALDAHAEFRRLDRLDGEIAVEQADERPDRARRIVVLGLARAAVPSVLPRRAD